MNPETSYQARRDSIPVRNLQPHELLDFRKFLVCFQEWPIFCSTDWLTPQAESRLRLFFRRPTSNQLEPPVFLPQTGTRPRPPRRFRRFTITLADEITTHHAATKRSSPHENLLLHYQAKVTNNCTSARAFEWMSPYSAWSTRR